MSPLMLREQVTTADASPAVSPDAIQAVGTGDLLFDPLTPDPSALPGRGELPVPANLYG